MKAAKKISLLRWAGSKRKLVPKLLPYWGGGFNRYIEPFAGSAVLFFAIQPEHALLSDINADLIHALTMVRDNPSGLHKTLHRFRLGKRNYNRLRALDVQTLQPAEKAARFLFLNRFCFNGLYRTNVHGQFNVPFSPSGTGTLPTRGQLTAASRLLKTAEIRCGDFETVLRNSVFPGDFVYLDPPYAVGNRRVFRQYGPDSFGLEDLERLAKLLHVIDERGARFVLSYADCREARHTFRPWRSTRVLTHRNISGFAKHRRRAAELIVTNC